MGSASSAGRHPSLLFALTLSVALVLTWLGPVATALALTFGAGVAIDGSGGVGVDPSPFFNTADPVGINRSRLTFPPITTSINSASAAISHFSGTTGGGGTGTAAADLALGTLGVFARSVVDGRIDALAGFSDTLTPTSTGFEHFDITVTGTATRPTSLGILFAIDNTFLLGARGEPLAGGGCPIGAVTTLCHYAFDVAASAGIPFTLTLTLQGLVGGDNTLDASKTLTLRASGVGFTSDSGVFLSGATIAVPGPGTLLLVSSGLLALGAAAWGRHDKKDECASRPALLLRKRDGDD
jgi:hypothetical protein